MYLAHFILPFAIYYLIKKDKIMLFGLLLGNIVDLDHISFRINHGIEIFTSSCDNFLEQCSFGTYRMHSLNSVISLSIASVILFVMIKKHKEMKSVYWIFWACIGALLNLLLDYIHLLTGVGFAIR